MDPRQNGRQRQLQPQNTEQQHQRFSWQTPLSTPPEEQPRTTRQPQQYLEQHSQHQHLQQQQAHVDTNPNPQHNRALSYAQTPIEHRAPYYISSPNDPPLPQSPPTPIDPRPQSTYDPRSSNPPATSYLSSLQPDEKPPFSPLTPHYGTPPPPFSPVSPMTEPQRIYIQQSHMPHVLHPHHGRQLSSLSPINTNLDHQTNLVVPVTPHSYNTQASPLPQKTPITPISPGVIKKDPAGYPLLASANSNNGYSAEPYSPHGFSSATNTRHAVFSPDSAHGPNGLDFTLHQPGQIAHPNMDLSGKGKTHEWKHSLCECSGDISTCLTGLFCPCILYGRTSYRMTQKSEKKDPTDMLGYKSTNGYCMLMGVSCGLWWLFPLYQRTRVRHAYKLSGSLGSDVVKAGCCCCCIAIQNEREVRDREESTRRWAGPASTEVYTAPRQMVYSPQR